MRNITSYFFRGKTAKQREQRIRLCSCLSEGKDGVFLPLKREKGPVCLNFCSEGVGTFCARLPRSDRLAAGWAERRDSSFGRNFSFAVFCGSTCRTLFIIKEGVMSKEYDPRMHTAEHALSGVLIRRYGCPRCFSTHINANKSKVDFHFPHDLSPEDASSIADEVNRGTCPRSARDSPEHGPRGSGKDVQPVASARKRR